MDFVLIFIVPKGSSGTPRNLGCPLRWVVEEGVGDRGSHLVDPHKLKPPVHVFQGGWACVWSPWREPRLSWARVGGWVLEPKAKFHSILNYIKFICAVMMSITHESSKKMLIVVLAIFGQACFGRLPRCAQHRVLPAGCVASPLPGTDMLSAVKSPFSNFLIFKY